MHEQSQTVGRNGRYYNINGLTGQPLPPMYPFEQPSYDMLEMAILAAKIRSEMMGQSTLDPEMFSGMLRGTADETQPWQDPETPYMMAPDVTSRNPYHP